jgi:hypothetical protein
MWSVIGRGAIAPVLFSVAIGGATEARAQSASSATPAAPTFGCKAPEHRQFDFWVGDWEVRTPNGTRAGENRIEAILDGCVVKEHWVGARGGAGESFNRYDAASRKWEQTWVDNGGNTLLLAGELTDGAMLLTGTTKRPDGGTMLHRVRWSLIDGDADRLRQLWETSSDGGASWTVSFDGRYQRKK